MDSCLGGLSSNGLYRYYSFSPCVWPSTYKSGLSTPSLCRNDFNCASNPQTYARALVTDSNYQTQKVIGIAKDGHQILGPFKSDGSVWQPCEVDACNGVTINGSYYYVMTKFYPYTIGCWGPANTASYTLTCTTNQRVCSSRLLDGEDLLSSGATLL